MNNDPNDPSRYRRFGRDYIGEQAQVEAKEDSRWTVYLLVGLIFLFILAAAALYFGYR